MKKEEVEKLQAELIGIISCIPASSNDSADKDRALEIIKSLGCDHINDIVLYASKKATILDFIIELDSTPHISILGNDISTYGSYRTRLNNKTLVELEESVKSFGGKESEDLKGLLDRIKGKIRNGSKIGAFVAIITFVIIGIIVGMIVGAVIGTIIGIGAEIKTGINSLASKVGSNLQNTTAEQVNVDQQQALQ